MMYKKHVSDDRLRDLKSNTFFEAINNKKEKKRKKKKK